MVEQPASVVTIKKKLQAVWELDEWFDGFLDGVSHLSPLVPNFDFIALKAAVRKLVEEEKTRRKEQNAESDV